MVGVAVYQIVQSLFMKRLVFSFSLLFAVLTGLSSFTLRSQGEQQKSYALYGVAF